MRSSEKEESALEAWHSPLLKPWYKVVFEDDKCMLHYGTSVAVLEGKAAAQLLPVLLPLLDGTRTVEEIVAYVGKPIEPAVGKALAILDEHDLLTEGPPLASDLPMPIAEGNAFFAATSFKGLPPDEVAATIERADVAVVGSGRLADQIGELLLLSGVKKLRRLHLDAETEIGSRGTFAVVTPSPEETPKLEDWNERALDIEMPWLQVLPFDGAFAAIGPLYVPGETCCYECFLQRRAGNVEFGEELRKLEAATGTYPVAAPLATAVAGLAATFAMRWLVEKDFFLPGQFYALETAGEWKLTIHTVYRVPRCPKCSRAVGVAQPLPWHSSDVIA